MQFYAIILIAWTAVAASLESNVTKFNNEKAVNYTEFRDLPAKQIAQSYLENAETKNPEKTSIKDHSDHNVNGELSSTDVSADESSDAFTSLPVSIHSTSFTKTIANYPFRRHLNYEPKHTEPEDALLVENAGSFGEKVWQSHPDDKAIAKSTTETTNSRLSDKQTNLRKSLNSSVSLENEDEDHEEPYVSITHEPLIYAQRKENISDNLSTDNQSREVIKDPDTKSLDENFDVRSVTENSPLGSGTYRDVMDQITKKSAELDKKLENVDGTSTSVEISPSVQIRKFSAPIVVPDLPDTEDSPQDGVVVDYLDDNDASRVFKSVESAEFISKIDVEPSEAATASNSITTSSIMLNPLQVGITLMNADEADLMDNSEQSATGVDTRNYFPNNLQRLATVNEEFAHKNQSRVDCKDENFQCDKEDKSVGVVTQKIIPDNSVEIQKSVELYYAAPVHEIHYPAEYVPSFNLDITKTNNALQRSKQQYDQGNRHVDRNVVKTHAFELPQKHDTRHEYNALEDDGKTMASALIGESSIREQTPYEIPFESQPLKYNNAQPVKPHTSNAYREQLRSNNPFRSSEIKRPGTSQLLLKIIPEGSSADGGFLVPIPQIPYPIEKITERTHVRVSRPIEIEKVIEKKVPIPVQQAPVSQLYPVRMQVPIDHIAEKQIRGPQLYPIYIEKRIPHVVWKRLLSSAYPQHTKLPAAYSTEKSPSHVPMLEKVTLEKPATFSLPSSRLSYRAKDAEDRLIDNGAVETKFINKYQHKLRETALVGENANSRVNAIGGFANFVPHQSETNTSQFYNGSLLSAYERDKSYIPNTGHTVKLMLLPKKFNDHVLLRSHVIVPSYAVPMSFRRHIMYNLVEKDKATIKDAGLVSPRKTTQDKTAFSQIRFSPLFSAASAAQISAMTALKRSRHPEARYTGNFRQSKMEYGFKPPMIPSVQYDEKTGNKVEN